jgi:hypothetical protein
METINLKNTGLIALNYNEMLYINGGDEAANQAAYDAGHAVGDMAREVVDGVILLAATVLRFFV